MMLDVDETEVMNTCLSYKCNYDEDVVINDVLVQNFGVFIDNKAFFKPTCGFIDHRFKSESNVQTKNYRA